MLRQIVKNKLVKRHFIKNPKYVKSSKIKLAKRLVHQKPHQAKPNLEFLKAPMTQGPDDA